tara:strand:- start:2443 stop:2550 length:108 start_codon:yes stop_codon:yes gene_type:complete
MNSFEKSAAVQGMIYVISVPWILVLTMVVVELANR